MNPFFKELKNVKMTRDEKSRIRHTLVTLTKSRMSDYRQPTKSPFATPVKSWGLAHNFRAVGAAVLILILASTGVSFAAEKTLPGDLLYPVKVNVTEEVRGALITSSDAKMDWEKERVVRRVVETEILLKNDNLTPKRKIQAEAAIKTQMATFATAAAETSEKNPNAVIAATAELEPALKVHQEVIANIAATSDAHSVATSEILSTVALGITATSEQETVAIASAVTNAPDTFAMLTDAKISGAEFAIDTSDINIKEEKIKEDEKAEVATMSALGTEITKEDIKTDPTEAVVDPAKINPSPLSIVEPATGTLKSSITNDTTLQSEDVASPTATLKMAAPVTLDPKEVLANAKAKLAQAKVLREQGKYKEALTLAQEAYKDMVALKLQAKIVNKAKSEESGEKIPGEVKGTQTEIKTEPKTETKIETKTEVKTEIPKAPILKN
jgi:hypothetical protein